MTSYNSYDFNYYEGHKKRYKSMAHSGRVANITSVIKRFVPGKVVLDIGSGCGFFTNIINHYGANVIGIDNSIYAINWAKHNYIDIKFIQKSALQVREFAASVLLDYTWYKNFNLVTAIDVIEHISDTEIFFKNVKSVLRDSGHLIISTDIRDSKLGKFDFMLRLSQSGRDYIAIKKGESGVEKPHINLQSVDELSSLVTRNGFTVVDHKIYQRTPVFIRDLFLRFFPIEYRYDHQTIVCKLNERG